MSISHLDADFVSAIRTRLRRHWGHQSQVFLRRSWDSMLAKAERLALANTLPIEIDRRSYLAKPLEHGLAGGPHQGRDGIEVVLARTGR